jgi:hypothetical protein
VLSENRIESFLSAAIFAFKAASALLKGCYLLVSVSSNLKEKG